MDQSLSAVMGGLCDFDWWYWRNESSVRNIEGTQTTQRFDLAFGSDWHDGVLLPMDLIWKATREKRNFGDPGMAR